MQENLWIAHQRLEFEQIQYLGWLQLEERCSRQTTKALHRRPRGSYLAFVSCFNVAADELISRNFAHIFAHIAHVFTHKCLQIYDRFVIELDKMKTQISTP